MSTTNHEGFPFQPGAAPEGEEIEPEIGYTDGEYEPLPEGDNTEKVAVPKRKPRKKTDE